MPDPSVSPADTIPYDDLRLEVAGAVERGDEYQPVSVASLTTLLDAYNERAALLAVGERDRRQIAQLTEALERLEPVQQRVLGETRFTLAQAKGYIRTVSEERKDGGGQLVSEVEERLSEIDALRTRLRRSRAVLAGEEDAE